MYMHSQNDINPKMRAILVSLFSLGRDGTAILKAHSRTLYLAQIDWLVEVHMKFRLASPTLYLTVFLIDR